MPENTEITDQNQSQTTDTTPTPIPFPLTPTPPTGGLRGKSEGGGEMVELGVVEPLGQSQAQQTQPQTQPQTQAKRDGRNTPGFKGTPKPAPDLQAPWVPVTEPKYKTFYTDHDNIQQRPRAGLNYWRSLTRAQQDRIDVYVYRDWPVLKVLPEDSKEYAYIDKILGTEPLQDETDLFDRYGSGDYRLFLNQTLSAEVAKDLKQAPKRTLATLYIRGLRDLKSRPPNDKRVSDIAQVDMDDVSNKNYVEFLRMTGKLPEQQKGRELETEMATIEAVKGMADMNRELMREVVTIAKDNNKREPPPTSDATAMSNAIGIISDAAKRSNEMLQDTIQTIREKDREGAGGGKEMLDTALALAERLTGAGRSGDGTAMAALMEEVKELRGQVAQMQQAQINDLQSQLRAVSERLANPPAAVTPAASAQPFSDVDSVINSFEKMRGMVEKVTGKKLGGGDEGEGETGGAPAWLNRVSDLAPHVSTVVSAARDMFALWQMNGGQTPTQQQTQPRPMPPVQVQPQPQQFQQTPPQPQPGPQLVTSNPQPQPQPQSQPQPTPPTPEPLPEFGNTYGLPPMVAEKLAEIKIAFLNHLEGVAAGELNGGDFADWYIGGFTEEGFKEITSNGAGILLQAVYAYPPIADRIEKTKATREQVEGFVKEFVAFKPEQELELEPEREMEPAAGNLGGAA